MRPDFFPLSPLHNGTVGATIAKVNQIGGLAQLVERLLCKQDVSGSSPLTSIRNPHCLGD